MPNVRTLTPEELDEYTREYVNSLRRASYARHPERVMRQRLASAANLLNRQGYIDDQTRSTILHRLSEGVSV